MPPGTNQSNSTPGFYYVPPIPAALTDLRSCFLVVFIAAKKKKKTIKFTILGVQVGGVHYIHMVVQQISGTFHLATVKVSPTDTNFPLHLPPALGNHLSAVCFRDFDCSACFP